MEVIQEEQLDGKTVAIDGKHFVNCKYVNCDVVYGGGDFSWMNTTFQNCRISFTGAAQKTMALLGQFGILPAPGPTRSGSGGAFGFQLQ
jgi:hypothetical protein